jgi:hypothetical protein
LKKKKQKLHELGQFLKNKQKLHELGQSQVFEKKLPNLKAQTLNISDSESLAVTVFKVVLVNESS